MVADGQLHCCGWQQNAVSTCLSKGIKYRVRVGPGADFADPDELSLVSKPKLRLFF